MAGRDGMVATMDEQAPFELSEWQQKAIRLTSDIIKMKVMGKEEGPRYIPMPTGAGKTTGAIEAIVDLLEAGQDCRFCFLTPYRDSVKDVYDKLVERLGETRVGYYHGDGEMDKEEALQRDVVVLTHKFLSPAENRGRLNDRTLFIVDEAIFANNTVEVKISEFAEAFHWAQEHGVMVDAFRSADAYARQMRDKLDEFPEIKFFPPYEYEQQDWARELSEDFHRAEFSQHIGGKEHPVDKVLKFSESLVEGMVVLARNGFERGKQSPQFAGASLYLPKINDTIILSATGGLSYQIEGSIREADGSKAHFVPPSYENLTLTYLPMPDFGKARYKEWGYAKIKPNVVDYVKWVLDQVEEDEIYLTAPKTVLDQCLRELLSLPIGGNLKDHLPFTTKIDGKTIHVSHHAISIGTNQFKDCKAVVYLWDNHVPQTNSVQKVSALLDEAVEEDFLKDANKRKLGGKFSDMRDAQLLDNILQQLGRGNMRNIDDEGKAGEMTAYLCVLSKSHRRLESLLAGCKTTKIEHERWGEVRPQRSIDKVIGYLEASAGEVDIDGREVEQATGVKLRKMKSTLEGHLSIMALGYEFESGQGGRGNSSRFVWIGK